jgi:hypothetical protein
MPSPEMMQKMMETMQQGQGMPQDFRPPEGQQGPPPSGENSQPPRPTSFWFNSKSFAASAINALINFLTAK